MQQDIRGDTELAFYQEVWSPLLQNCTACTAHTVQFSSNTSPSPVSPHRDDASATAGGFGPSHDELVDRVQQHNGDSVVAGSRPPVYCTASKGKLQGGAGRRGAGLKIHVAPTGEQLSGVSEEPCQNLPHQSGLWEIPQSRILEEPRQGLQQLSGCLEEPRQGFLQLGTGTNDVAVHGGVDFSADQKPISSTEGSHARECPSAGGGCSADATILRDSVPAAERDGVAAADVANLRDSVPPAERDVAAAYEASPPAGVSFRRQENGRLANVAGAEATGGEPMEQNTWDANMAVLRDFVPRYCTALSPNFWLCTHHRCSVITHSIVSPRCSALTSCGSGVLTSSLTCPWRQYCPHCMASRLMCMLYLCNVCMYLCYVCTVSQASRR